jgi:hypothetical protein
MSDLLTHVVLGFRHIADLRAMDHLLFLIALVAPYRAADWRGLVLVGSAFTIGHSITLALTVLNRPWLPTPMVEFLIPVTIIITAAVNLRGPHRNVAPRASAGMALGFGLIHGAGFANFLRTLFEGAIALPLLGFNLGIELGQLLIIAGALAVFHVTDRTFTLRTRARVASLATAAWALVVAVARAPW